MSFKVDFFQVSKRKNSTYVPDDSIIQRSYQCVVKDGTGVLNPVITVTDVNSGFNPSVHNYCHISDFHRYYWVSDWKNEDNMWTASLSVDVLATYKSTIESTNYYVLRTSTGMDTNIIDKFYPATTYTTYNKTSKQLWTNSTWASGTFVVGIIGKGGLTNFYLMNNTMFTLFIQKMFSDSDWMKVPVSDIPKAILKAAVNPAQYIISLFWLPFNLMTDISLIPTTIDIGFWEIALEGQIGSIRVLPDTYAPVTLLTEYTLSPHPQADRGYWLNHEPYTRSYVFNHSFGVISIDRSNVPADATIQSKINVDVRTGDAEMILSYGNTQLAYAKTSMACPVPVGEFKDKLVGLAATAVSAVSGIVNAVSGGFDEVVGQNNMGNDILSTAYMPNSAKGVGNALENMRGKSEVRNSTGSQLSGNGEMILYEEYVHIVNENNNMNGRPFCKTVNMKTQGSGYYIVSNGTTAIPNAFLSELDAVRAFLESGVYYA